MRPVNNIEDSKLMLTALKELRATRKELEGFRRELQEIKAKIDFIHNLYTTPAEKKKSIRSKSIEELVNEMRLNFDKRMNKKASR